MTISIIVGTRPEIIKMTPIIRECERLNVKYFILHTGQHYSYNMDKVFFDKLELPAPRFNLDVGSGSKNAGKVLTFFSHGKDLLPEVEVLEGNKLGDDFEVTNETIIMSDAKLLEGIGEYQFGFSDPETHVFNSRKGLDRDIVEKISAMKGEPQWMLDFRLRALDHFMQRPMPNWGRDLSQLNLDEIYFYAKPAEEEGRSWEDVPKDIKNTFDRLGIPEAEQKFLSGVGAQYESEMVYHSIQENLSSKGVIFKSIENGLRDHPDLFREYFTTLIPIEDNKFAALNSAVWSGGSFMYVPKVDALNP